jgi:Domain of unknown function (DUF929)
MPKCQKCGKKFDTLQSLKDHFRAVHPNDRFSISKPNTSRNLVVYLVIVIIVVGGLVGYLIYVQPPPGPGTSQTSSSGPLLQPISQALLNNLTTVSYTTLSSIGSGQGVAQLTPITSSPLMFNNKPEILYIGGEFCPLCAADRWSIVIALSKFGNFSSLDYMISAPDDGNVSTVTFRYSTYTSQYISFVAVENEDRAHNGLQQTNQSEQQLWNTYTANTYPFMDIGGKYIVKSELYSYVDLNGLSWTQIGSQLNNSSSTVAKAIDGAANELISAICKIDGGTPASICGQTFANVSFKQLPTANPFLYLMVSYMESASMARPRA